MSQPTLAAGGAFLGMCLAILSGCQGSSVLNQSVSLPGGDGFQTRTVVSDYLPAFRSGQIWVYTSRQGSSESEISYEVITVNSREVLQKVSVSGAGQNREAIVSINRFGVPLEGGQQIDQQVSFGGFLGPRTQVNQSVNLGNAQGVDVHQSVSSGGTTVSQDVEPLRFALIGTDSVSVPAGSYQADRYLATSNQAGKQTSYTLWLVKGIGEVKSTLAIEGVAGQDSRELKRFSDGSGASLALK